MFVEHNGDGTYQEAIDSTEKNNWHEAMKMERKALDENDTWKLQLLPQGKKLLKSMWAYKVKTHADGSIDKYKARLVIKGCAQRKGTDYEQTFSPVVRGATIRALLSTAARMRNSTWSNQKDSMMGQSIVRDHRHRNLQHSIRRPCISLGRQQLPDGGFGNVYNTALALQALHDVSDIGNYRNKSAAILYIESKQDPDGAFTDPGLTADVILALSSKGLESVRNLDCGRTDMDMDNHVEFGDLSKSISSGMYNDSDPRNITVSYTLWVGTNVSENHTILLTALRNTSFYSIMQMAAESDSHFAFEASEWPNGHYVHTLSGYKEEPMGYHYWLLYRLPELPDPTSPPANQLVAPVGVDDLLIEEGDHYLFWYKKL